MYHRMYVETYFFLPLIYVINFFEMTLSTDFDGYCNQFTRSTFILLFINNNKFIQIYYLF